MESRQRSGRKTKVKNGDARSDELIMKSGVPLGSVLGSTLYLLFISNIQRLNLIGEYTVYADDTRIVAGAKDGESLKIALNQDLDHINRWFKGNLTLTFS